MSAHVTNANATSPIMIVLFVIKDNLWLRI